MASMSDRMCDGCGEPLGVTRSDAAYCSGACRQRAYRDRRRILNRYGSWENALAECAAFFESRVTASSRNTEQGE